MILARQRYREDTEDPEYLSLSTVEEATDLVMFLISHGLPFGVETFREGATIMRGPHLSYTVHVPAPLPPGITLEMLLGAVRTGLMRRGYIAHADEAFRLNDLKIAAWQVKQDRARDRFIQTQHNRHAHTILIPRATK
jgi:hypothetical protein